MDKERFSLLLLEPGEIYFEDFSAHFLDPKDVSNISIGRLKMCSKSIVFDPKDKMSPIIKIPLKDCIDIYRYEDKLTDLNMNNVLVVTCKQYVEMLEGNQIAPYKFQIHEKTFMFHLNYAKVIDCLPQICQLHRASTLNVVEQNSMISAIVHSRHSRIKFDPLWMSDLYERVVLETTGDLISPLCVNPGRVLLSNTMLYFQPYNNIEPSPVLKVRLRDIKSVIKRRFLLRQIGLHINCDPGVPSGHSEHMFLSLGSCIDRDELHQRILEQDGVHLRQLERDEITLQWQNGIISNYEYLLYINSLADRTFSDLTQYPVFPWVIKDYTSAELKLDDPSVYRDLTKPVGALNPDRLERLRERFEEMKSGDENHKGNSFLYGSHYSAPGLVLFYLVRRCPRLMLCLQNGRFDHPDRMFNCVADVYRNVLNNMSDFKELIPEFYDTDNHGDFLVNSSGINFGFKYDGVKVGDVILPEWASNHEDFIRKLRGALESDYVSKNLHHWIDLIFGYKQNGVDAEKANNLFYYLCYEGAVNLDSIAEPSERHALEVQIMEFGQIPKQLFKRPHVSRLTNIPQSISLLDIKDCDKNLTYGNRIITCDNISQLKSLMAFHSHKDCVSCVLIGPNEDTVVSVGHDSLLKVYCIKEHRQVRSVSIGTMPLSSCLQMPDGKTLIVSSWDNNIVLYDLEYGRIMQSIQAHGDAVSCLAFPHQSDPIVNTRHDQLLISGSWDCSVRAWRGIRPDGPLKHSQNLIREVDHDARITCVQLASDNKTLLSGTEDGEVFLWDLRDDRAPARCLHKHQGKVTSISLSSDCTKLLSCSEDECFAVVDLVTGTVLLERQVDQPLRCSLWRGPLALLGGAYGSLYAWDMVHVAPVLTIKSHTSAVTSVAMSDGLIVTGGEDFYVKLWCLNIPQDEES